ncbi:17716_t:CDS:1, partial [Racocetra persica]
QSKVLAMNQIQSDIFWSCKIKNAKEYNNQICRLYIATSILNDENIKQELIITNLDYHVSDNNDVEEKITTRSYNQKNQSLEENKNLVIEKNKHKKI